MLTCFSFVKYISEITAAMITLHFHVLVYRITTLYWSLITLNVRNCSLILSEVELLQCSQLVQK